MLPRGLAGQRLDPAHAAGDCAFRDDGKHPDVAQRAHMGAAAQFDRIGLPADRPSKARALHRRIFHRTAPSRLLRWRRRGSSAGWPLLVAADFGVHFGLDRSDIVRGDGRVREIEAQPVRRDHAALLRHMPAQPVAQRGVEQVGGGVVGADRIAPCDVDLELHDIADLDLARLHRGT